MGWLPFAMLAAGLVLLVVGAEVLVHGASQLAVRLGISPLVVGLTVVAIGTGSPELAVTVQATLEGKVDLLVGNVVGSNIANVLLVIGSAAIAAPLLVARGVVFSNVPIMIAVSVLVLMFARDGALDQVEGGVMVAGSLAYMTCLVLHSRSQARNRRQDPDGVVEESEMVASWGTVGWDLLRIVIGLGVLVWGSRWVIDGAVAIATAFQVDELIIGLSIVAIGTSLPEIATSIVAAFRGHRDIAVGNAVGSNIFNLLMVLGIGAAISGQDGLHVTREAMTIDLPIMILVAFLCLPVFYSGYRVSRFEGLMLIGFYFSYLGYLYLLTVEHPRLHDFERVMSRGVIPLTCVLLMLSCWRFATRERRGSANPGRSGDAVDSAGESET